MATLKPRFDKALEPISKPVGRRTEGTEVDNDSHVLQAFVPSAGISGEKK